MVFCYDPFIRRTRWIAFTVSNASTHFITGVTGFVGSHLALRLLLDGERVVAMARAPDNEAARRRMLGVLASIDAKASVPLEQLVVFAGDVQDAPETIVRKLRSVYAGPIDTIWHSAVTFKFRQRDLPEIKAINIQGSRNVIRTVLCVNGDGPRPRYMHVSTAYSSGRLQGTVPEDIVASTPDYRGLYEWSKHKVELEVAQFQREHGLDLTVLRPAIIVGCEDSESVTHSGYYQVIGTIYKIYLMYKRKYGGAFNREIPMRFEANPRIRLNLVPIDFVIDSMVALAQAREIQNSELKVFNLVNENAPVLSHIVEVTEASLGITGLTIVDEAEFARTPMNALEKVFARTISFQAPYIKEDVAFETERFRALVKTDAVPVPVVDTEAMTRLNLDYFRLVKPELDKTLHRERAQQLEKSLQI